MDNAIQVLVSGDKVITAEYVGNLIRLKDFNVDFVTTDARIELDHSFGAEEPVIRIGPSKDEHGALDGVVMCSYLPDSSTQHVLFDRIHGEIESYSTNE